MLTACMTAGFTPNIAHYADEWDSGTALVAHGFGIILVPRPARLHDWPVVRIPLHGEPAPARRVLAATRLGHRDHPLVTTALQTIDTTATTLQPPPRRHRRRLVTAPSPPLDVLWFRMSRRLPPLRYLTGCFIGVGVRPEHIRAGE